MHVKIALTLLSFEATSVTITSDERVKNWCVDDAVEWKKSSAQAHNPFSEFTPMLADHLFTPSNLLLLDDYNYYANAEANVYTKTFFSLLENYWIRHFLLNLDAF